jgi:hypothetical protein
MSDQAGILPKLFSNWGIILAKGQLDHSYQKAQNALDLNLNEIDEIDFGYKTSFT